MKKQYRIWLLASITPMVIMLLIRLGWHGYANRTLYSISYVVLLELAMLIGYGIVFYFLTSTAPKKFQKKFVRISVIVLVNLGMVGGVVHFIRYVPSPEAINSLAIALAALLLVGGLSGYALFVKYMWDSRSEAKKG